MKFIKPKTGTVVTRGCWAGMASCDEQEQSFSDAG